MKLTRFFALFFSALLFLSAPVFAANYAVDTDHTSVSFKVHHILGWVEGHFKKFEGNFAYEPGKSETWQTKGTIDVAGIDTNVPERDKHLRSADFFDAEKYPTISFVSTQVTDANQTGAKLHGLITIHGVEKPVVLDVQPNGVMKDPWGNTRASFTATAKLNRKDFGMVWNQVLDKGQLLVGEEVVITLEVDGLLKE